MRKFGAIGELANVYTQLGEYTPAIAAGAGGPGSSRPRNQL